MTSIFLFLAGEQKGPFFPGQIRSLLAEGTITNETPAWHEGLADWSSVGAVLAALPAASGPPPVPASAMPRPRRVAQSPGVSGGLIAAIVAGAIFVLFIPCCAGIALGPITSGIKIAKENVAMQRARQIELIMMQYSVDHNGAYPDGKTSTEVFQKLIDGKYVTDPTIFYLEMPGKTKPTSSQLTADNVSYDVTSGVTATSPDVVPVVFCTGYTVTYTPHAGATRDNPVATPFPGPGLRFSGIAVAYKSGYARFQRAQADGSIADFIPLSFDAGGKKYVQLRP
jgi:hypothetical protein